MIFVRWSMSTLSTMLIILFILSKNPIEVNTLNIINIIVLSFIGGFVYVKYLDKEGLDD